MGWFFLGDYENLILVCDYLCNYEFIVLVSMLGFRERRDDFLSIF